MFTPRLSDDSAWRADVAVCCHGGAVVGQTGLQSEKTSLHEKHDAKAPTAAAGATTHDKSKKKSKDSLSFAQDGFVLPQVRGAEGTFKQQSNDVLFDSQSFRVCSSALLNVQLYKLLNKSMNHIILQSISPVNHFVLQRTPTNRCIR